ncbi:hypothetical protein CRE_12018 [Caenorhabditis remanei]|uniref:F-box C protein n=1 Tax=Caenorhabditis remanei TaxID=31234 RepID=E3MPS1_CAERE|nr:hypothetical protein CRE_12018 [Caenorhabditis remanei]
MSNKSVESVLKHMEANKRFLLSSKCPSIRTIDQATPLKIQSFSANNNSLKINNTEYKLGVYRKYSPDTLPPIVQKMNDDGGLPDDLDEYGFEDKSGRNKLTPGDVDLRDPRVVEDDAKSVGNSEQISIPDHEEKLEKFYRLLDQAQGFGPIVRNHDHRAPKLDPKRLERCITYFLDDTVSFHATKCPEFEMARQISYDKLDNDIKNLEAKLQPFYSRQDGEPPPYESYIQVTVTTGAQSHVERVKYSKKLHEALKYLSARFFGGREHPVIIKEFDISLNGIIRFPPELRLQIQEMIKGSDIQVVQKHMAPILVTPVYRLTLLVNSDADLQCQILREAKILSFREQFGYDVGTEAYLNLKNQFVHKSLVHPNNWTDFLFIVKRWLDVKKPVGTCRSFGIVDVMMEDTILEKFRKKFKGTKGGRNLCIYIPTKWGTQIKVSTVEDSYRMAPWVLKFEILPR